MDHQRTIAKQRQRRVYRVRKRVRGTPERPRLTVTRSHKHISAQIIDDLAGKTLACASSRDQKIKYGGNQAAAQTVGKTLAERAVKAGISVVCFDRGRYKYHGRVAALADAAREGGLKF